MATRREMPTPEQRGAIGGVVASTESWISARSLPASATRGSEQTVSEPHVSVLLARFDPYSLIGRNPRGPPMHVHAKGDFPVSVLMCAL